MSKIVEIAKKIRLNDISSKVIKKPIRNTNHFNKNKFIKKYIIKEKFINKRQIITLTKNNDFNRHIVFLHGGSYKDEAIIVHRIFIEKILDNYEYKVSFFDYPLTPEVDYREIQKFTLEAFKYINKEYENDTFFLMGDSAGGGLAVRLLQILNKEKIFSVKKTILISPWLDVSMSNKRIINQIEKDFTLNYNDLIDSGINYSGKLNPKNKIVSPIYGNLNNLGLMQIYTCENELLYPDICKFNKLVNEHKNSNSTLIIEKELFHDWALVFIKETKNTLKKMIEFLQ